MTVSVQTPYNLATGNGVTTVFPYQFKILSNTDLQVYVGGVLKALGIDYTVSGVGADVGGSVTFIAGAPAALLSVSIIRAMAVRRSTDYQQLGDFLTPVVNPDFDNAILLIQDLQTQDNRSVRTPADEVGTIPTLPSIAARTGKYIAFDASGQPIASSGTGNDTALRVDLASQLLANDGARLIGRRRSETGGVARTLTQLLDRQMYAEDFGLNTVPGTTNMSVAIQAAIDAATDVNSEIYLHDDNAQSTPLLIRTTTQQNAGLVGRGRVSTILRPLASDIKTAPININAQIINQSNNGHFGMRRLRWLTGTGPGYTGVFMDAKEGGGGDASLQAAFSSLVEDCWFSPQSTNGGVFHGGFSNLVCQNSVFESTKTACWILDGAGNSDHFHSNVVMNAGFDAYIDSTALTSGTRGALISVKGLHAYQHFRGPLLNMSFINGMTVTDISVEANAAQVGTISLGKYNNCKDVLLIGGVAATGNGTPRIANGLEFSATVGETTSATVMGYRISADVGLRVSGAGTIDLTVYDSDFIGCQYAFQHLSGNTLGKLKLVNCRLNFAEYCMLMSAGTPTYTIEAYFCEFMNAGYDGTVPGVPTGRNISLSSTANHRFVGCKIGHDDAKATATHRWNLTGVGTVLMQDPYLVGTPPTAFAQGAQALSYDGVDSTMPGMPQFVPSLGGNTTYSVQTGSWSLKGGRVHISGEITVTLLGTGSTSVVSGLPFPVGAGTPGVGYVSQFSGLAVSPVFLGLLCSAAATTFTMKGLTAAAAATATLNVFGNGANIRFAGSYQL